MVWGYVAADFWDRRLTMAGIELAAQLLFLPLIREQPLSYKLV